MYFAPRTVFESTMNELGSGPGFLPWIALVLVLRFTDVQKYWRVTYRVAVQFEDAPGVYRGTPVRLNGVPIGSVSDGAATTRSCARRSLAAATIFIAFVICRMFLTARTRRLRSCKLGIC